MSNDKAGSVIVHVRDAAGVEVHHERYDVDDVDAAIEGLVQLRNDAASDSEAPAAEGAQTLSIDSAGSSTTPAKKAAKPRAKKRR